MKRRLLAVPLVVLAGLGLYRFALRDTAVEPHLRLARATSMIGTGAAAVGVAADGSILRWLPPPEESSLPELPLSTPPQNARLSGTMLAQARVLGAVPARLRPYVRGSIYGESGVDVELRSGIELRFGDASRAKEKWRAAAAILADPAVTALDYVDLRAPGRPATDGSGHGLPAVP